jgi:hypothetical protein
MNSTSLIIIFGVVAVFFFISNRRMKAAARAFQAPPLNTALIREADYLDPDNISVDLCSDDGDD